MGKRNSRHHIKEEDKQMVKDKYKDLPYIYKVRRALEDCVEEKLNGVVTDAGTWLDFSGADFAFEFKNRRYNIEINDITNTEDKPKDTTSKEWVKGYKKWQNENKKRKLKRN